MQLTNLHIYNIRDAFDKHKSQYRMHELSQMLNSTSSEAQSKAVNTLVDMCFDGTLPDLVTAPTYVWGYI